MSDVLTPFYRTRIAKGEIINNPMQQFTHICTEEACTLDVSFLYTKLFPCGGANRPVLRGNTTLGTRPSSQFINGTAFAPQTVFAPAPDIDVQGITDALILELHANVNQVSAYTLECFAEIRKTLDLLVSILRKVVGILRALRTLDIRSLAGKISAKDYAEMRLNYRFGLIPLVNDIRGVASLLQERELRHTFRVVRKVSEQNVQSKSTSSTSSSEGTSQTHSRVFTSTTKRSLTVRPGMLTEISANIGLGLGLDKILETAWELVPYSFLVDKFLSVGNWIAAWTPNLGIRSLASWVVVTDKTESVTELTSQSSSYVLGTGCAVANMHYIMSNCKLTETTTLKTRVVEPSRPYFPLWDLRVNLETLLDLVAIMRTFL